jgi:hypothetical protein
MRKATTVSRNMSARFGRDQSPGKELIGDFFGDDGINGSNARSKVPTQVSFRKSDYDRTISNWLLPYPTGAEARSFWRLTRRSSAALPRLFLELFSFPEMLMRCGRYFRAAVAT